MGGHHPSIKRDDKVLSKTVSFLRLTGLVQWVGWVKARLHGSLDNRRKLRAYHSLIKRRLSILKKHLPKFIIAFILSGLFLGLIQSYNQTDNDFRKYRSNISQELENQFKAKGDLRQQFNQIKAQSEQQKAENEDLKRQLQTKRQLESPIAFVGRGGGDTSGYYWGQCVWYVASKLPIPGHWSNASDWDEHARAEGYVVSPIPKVGSVAQMDDGWYGHVGIVNSINGDMVELNEMNVFGVGIQDYRWVHVSEYEYIYI